MRLRIETKRLLGALAGVVLAVSGQAALAAEACPGLPLRQPPPREAIPAAFTEPQWVARNNQLEQQMAGANFSRTRLLFLGDSITESWPPNLYQHFYGHRGAFNMGVRSDNTMGMLWRLPRAPLGRTLKPQLVVLLLGTNNIWPGAKPEDVATGIAEVVRQIRRQSPTSRVLLVGVLPRGADASEPARPVIAQVNALLAGCADNSTVFFANPGPMLLDGQGVLSEQMSPDRLHLTWLGYAILGAGLEPDIRRILGE